VRPGDTLGEIARRHGVSVRVLARANGITNVNLVRIGQYLTIPERRRISYYRVRWGDTLIGIASQFGTTVSSIRSQNPTLGTYPLAGQWLKLCTNCTSGATYAAPSAGASTSSGTSSQVYVVQPGDTLSGIAVRYAVSTSNLVSLNGLANPDLVVIGSRLRIPGGSGTSYGYDPAFARSLIVEYANLYGLDPSLPLAIGWQESGFNENMISKTGAIGVMQVEPYTGDTISALLGRRMNLYDIRDNIQAGVFWISQLLQYYGGDARMAAAAYYQGTHSLARHGFFQDTLQYVADVLALKTNFGG
jgi:LysM repeat protein